MKTIMISLVLVMTTSISLAQDKIAKINLNESSLNKKENSTSIFQLFPTQNKWNFIKLNTRNGKMWQVQYGMENSNNFVTDLNLASLVTEEKEINGRFILYPTQNIWNFILLDQINGNTWQVQWSIEEKNRLIIPIR